MYPSVCSSYINVLYSYINLTILDFLHSVEIAFFLFPFFLFMCPFVLQFSCWRVIQFYLIPMSTGCLAPLAPMASSCPWLFQTASTLIFTFNIFIVVIYVWARVSTNKDCCRCCFRNSSARATSYNPQRVELVRAILNRRTKRSLRFLGCRHNW